MGEFTRVEHLNACQQLCQLDFAMHEPAGSLPSEHRSETPRHIRDVSSSPSSDCAERRCLGATSWRSRIVRSALVAVSCLVLLSCGARGERRYYGQCAIRIECEGLDTEDLMTQVRRVLKEQAIRYTGSAQLMDGTPAGEFFKREGEFEVAVYPPRQGTVWINFFSLDPSLEAFSEKVRHIQEELAGRWPDRVTLAEEIGKGPW
jgi:hypothetical protein